MKKIIMFTPLAIIIIAIMGFMSYNKSVYSTFFPTDVEGAGTVVDDILFGTWTNNATSSPNVFVLPADGPNFVGDNPTSSHPSVANNLDFHRWAEQMFLWILSPTPADGSYGNCRGLVLNSKQFYDFDLYNGVYRKHICPNIVDPGPVPSTQKGANKTTDVAGSMTFGVKGTNKGSKNLPILIEKDTDKIFDVDKTPLSKNGFPLVYDIHKNKVEVATIKTKNNQPVFYDTKGGIIEKSSLILSAGLDESTTVQQFVFNKTTSTIATIATIAGSSIFILPYQNQANTNSALMARNGSLVYYNIMVNDVFVAFSQMVKDHVISDKSLFPTTLEDEDNYDENGVNIPRIGLNTIKDYGATHGIPIVDTGDRVLAMELKTSWVETTNLPNSSNYVKINAKVPNYIPNPSLPGGWIRSGMRPTTLALVGMHVVGSVLGHPEMIWSTFEHINNTPNSAIDAITGTPSTGFIFNDGAAGTANISHIHGYLDLSGANGFPISASKTVRNMPFGWAGIPGQPGATGNPADVLPAAASDGQLTALYSDARSRLLPNDVRRNYFQVGAM